MADKTKIDIHILTQRISMVKQSYREKSQLVILLCRNGRRVMTNGLLLR